MHIGFSTYQHHTQKIENINDDTRIVVTLDTGAQVIARAVKWPIGDISMFIDAAETDKAVLEAIYAEHYDDFYDNLNDTWFRIGLTCIIWSETLTRIVGKAHEHRYERIMRMIREGCEIELLQNASGNQSDHGTFEIGGTLCVLPKMNSRGRSVMLPNLIRSVNLK